MGVLQGFDSVFSCEFPHNQCQLTVGCHVDWSRINSLNVFGGASAAPVHFHNKFNVFHVLSPGNNSGNVSPAAVHFFEVEYTTDVKGLPHSKQLAFNREVTNPQDGHIRCDRSPVIGGVFLRIQ
jgi:hypothetical protein